MRVNTKPRLRNSDKAEKALRIPPFRKWVRGRACAAEGALCSGKIECAHVDHAGGKGMGIKVHDRHCIPLCSGHHARQTNKGGWPRFERECLGGKSAVAMADAYFTEWLWNTPMGKTWRDKQDG